jgi:hypothetical protein
MAVVLLIVLALLLPAALLYLTLSVNDFEKNTKALAAVLQKRYHLEPPKKAAPGALSAAPAPGGASAGKPARP